MLAFYFLAKCNKLVYYLEKVQHIEIVTAANNENYVKTSK